MFDWSPQEPITLYLQNTSHIGVIQKRKIPLLSSAFEAWKFSWFGPWAPKFKDQLCEVKASKKFDLNTIFVPGIRS